MNKNLNKIINESIDSVIQEKKINSIINNAINEKILYSVVKQMVEDKIYEQIKKELSEKVLNEDEEQDIEDSNKYKSVMKSLKDRGINKADLMRALWHPKDKSEEDTGRSLFSKKANGTPDNDGAVRKFTSSEINKLYDLIRNLGK